MIDPYLPDLPAGMTYTVAPTPPPRPACPVWCDGQTCTMGAYTRTITHKLALLQVNVRDVADPGDADVPLAVLLIREDAILPIGNAYEIGPEETMLEVGHAFYTPGAVRLDRKQRALVAAALLTATHMAGMGTTP